MDAEHRHDLKRNDLADWIGHFPTFFKKYTNQILGVVLIILALLLWFALPKLRSRGRLDEYAQATSKIQSAKQTLFAAAQAEGDQIPLESIDASIITLDELAAAEENENLAALALIKKAEMLRAELHLDKEVTAETIEDTIAKARNAYEQALEKATSPSLKGLAEFGLGLCAEEVREFDKAREIYQRVIDSAEYAGTAVQVQARYRLEQMADAASAVIFAPAPPEAEKPADAQATQPAEQPAGEAFLLPAEPEPAAPFITPEENTETTTP